MSSSDQITACSAAILAMLDTGILNMPDGQPLCQANKDHVVEKISDILADHFSVETEKKIELPVKKPRGRPKGSKNKPKDSDSKTSDEEVPVKKSKVMDSASKAQTKKSDKKKKGRKSGGKNKHPSKTKKNIAAAIVIQTHARTLLAKKIAKNLTFAYSPSSKFISAMSDLYKEQSKKTNSSQ